MNTATPTTPPSPETLELIAAIRGRDTAALKHVLAEAGKIPGALDDQGDEKLTPLLWAVREGFVAAVEMLLAAGADPNRGLRASYAPLPLSIRLGEYAIAALVLQTPTLNEVSQGYVAAVDAVINRDVQGLRCLVEHGFALERPAPPEAGQTAIERGLNRATALLFNAIAMGLPDPEVFRFLLAQGAIPDAVDSRGATLAGLLCARVNEASETLQLLLAAGTQAAQLDGLGYAPLHYAAAQDHTNSTQTLLQHGAPGDQSATDGSFPLLWAAANPGGRVHRLLLDNTASSRIPFLQQAAQRLSSRWFWSADTTLGSPRTRSERRRLACRHLGHRSGRAAHRAGSEPGRAPRTFPLLPGDPPADGGDSALPAGSLAAARPTNPPASRAAIAVELLRTPGHTRHSESVP